MQIARRRRAVSHGAEGFSRFSPHLDSGICPTSLSTAYTFLNRHLSTYTGHISEEHLKKGFNFFLLTITCALPSLAASTYAGSDTACFYGITGSSCTLTSSKSSLGIGTSGPLLAYTPGSFTAPVTGGIIELGTFNVNRELGAAEAGTFDIDVTFTAPLGSGGQTYSASTLGAVVFGKGGVEITFDDPTTQVYTYPGGSFELSLPSSTILIGAGDSEDLCATITPLAAPEPASAAVVGGALALLALLRPRHRKPAQAEQTKAS